MPLEEAKILANKPVTLKGLPHSIEAEQSVIGGLMIDNDAWVALASQLTPDDFYHQGHRLVFAAIGQLSNDNKPFDPLTLAEYLENRNELQDAGGFAYLVELTNTVPSVANIDAYASIIRERSIFRKLVHTGKQIADNAYSSEGRNSQALIEEAERLIFSISQEQTSSSAPQGIRELLKKTIKKIEELAASDSPITGSTTGFIDLDALTSGLQIADLIIVAARPSMGKTTFAMNMAENIILSSDKTALVFSMEMPSDQLIMRILSSLGRINQSKIRTGQLDEKDWPKLLSAFERIKNKKLFIDDSPSISPADMRSTIRQLIRNEGELGVIVVDYLQLMQIPGFSEGRTNEISQISRSLKAIAKEFNVPVIALSQLNRSLEQRPNKRPINSDLRESGAIEQDADLILFIYRDEVYNPDTEFKGMAEIIISKQRNGPIGTVKLAFLGHYLRFENLVAEAFANSNS